MCFRVARCPPPLACAAKVATLFMSLVYVFYFLGFSMYRCNRRTCNSVSMNQIMRFTCTLLSSNGRGHGQTEKCDVRDAVSLFLSPSRHLLAGIEARFAEPAKMQKPFSPKRSVPSREAVAAVQSTACNTLVVNCLNTHEINTEQLLAPFLQEHLNLYSYVPCQIFDTGSMTSES